MSPPPKKILLLANHNNGYAVTEYLLNRKDAEIVAVAVLKDPPGHWWKSVKKLATQNNLNTIIFESNEKFYERIKKLDIDFIISASWRNIVPKKILSLAKLGAVNMHNSLLPKFRGSYANSWPLYFGETESGVSFHYMTEKFDDGNIIWQERFAIEPTDTAKEVWGKCNAVYIKMFKYLWPKCDEWKKMSKKQSGKPTFYSIKDFEARNEFDPEKKVKIKDFINFLRSRTFEPYYRNTFYFDKNSGKKIFVAIKLSDISINS